MYLEFHGLKEMPFDLAPNPRFLHFGPRHREAFNHLLYGIRQRKGFVLLTGEVGCGKTTICRAVLHELGGSFATALILNPVLPADQLMQAVALEFGLPVRGLDRFETLNALNGFLLELVHQDRDAVLIIDEAHDLTGELLEQVRLLSNLETDERKLLQIVLMGQTELRDRLNEHGLRQLRQRITVRFHLGPLREDELWPYIRHRLEVAGGEEVAVEFSRPALWRLYRYTGGIPRLVNAVCDKCLLAAYVQGVRRVTYRMVARAVRELEGEVGT